MDVDKLEHVQKRATKLIPELSKKYKRYRGDMLELFQIIKGIYDPACVPHLDFMDLTDNSIRTRGNKFKLV